MGSITTLFDNMSTIYEKHGPFIFALCVGDFYGSPGVNDGKNVENPLLDNYGVRLRFIVQSASNRIFSNSTVFLHYAR